MKILNTRSLLETIDNFNDARVHGKDWQGEPARLAEWLEQRLGKPGGYLDSFAMTPGDWERDFRLYTGERITTRAGRSHVIAEEANRVMKIIEKEAGLKSDALRISEERLGERIFKDCRVHVLETGEFCCGTCSVAFWRYLDAGGFSSYPGVIEAGLRTLAGSRLPGGGWHRFPFYYTLLFLSECGNPKAKEEIGYHLDSCRRRIKALGNKTDLWSKRKYELLGRILAEAAAE